jgi:DNA-binding transcriptional LysR family regulator
MPLNFTELRAFHAVAIAGSVGGGAEALMVSQPAVSKQIKQLERALGTRLFDRVPRGVRPTQAGELLAGYTRRIFTLADEARQAIDDLQGLRRGKVAIAASPMLATYLLPDVLVRFRRRFPAIALTLEVENADVLQRRLADGLVDAGYSEVPPERLELEGDVIMKDRLIAVASPGHALSRRRRRGQSLTLGQLCAQPFIVRETGSSGTRSLVERTLADRGLHVTPTLALGSTEAIKHAVAAGLGVAIISSLAARPELSSRRLVQLSIRDLALARPLYRLRLRNRRESKAAHAFDCLVRHAARAAATR